MLGSLFSHTVHSDIIIGGVCKIRSLFNSLHWSQVYIVTVQLISTNFFWILTLGLSYYTYILPTSYFLKMTSVKHVIYENPHLQPGFWLFSELSQFHYMQWGSISNSRTVSKHFHVFLQLKNEFEFPAKTICDIMSKSNSTLMGQKEWHSSLCMVV